MKAGIKVKVKNTFMIVINILNTFLNILFLNIDDAVVKVVILGDIVAKIIKYAYINFGKSSNAGNICALSPGLELTVAININPKINVTVDIKIKTNFVNSACFSLLMTKMIFV